MAKLDRVGKFKARPVSWQIVTYGTGSVALDLSFLILAEKIEEEWRELFGVDFSGSIFLLGRGGRELGGQVSIANAMGWDGRWKQFEPQSGWRPTDCVIETKEEDYNGERTLKLAYVHAIAVNYEFLEKQHGDKSRALLAGGPLPPPPPKPASSPNAQPVQESPF